MGLDVVRSQAERLKGSVRIHSEPGRGTRMELRLPLSLLSTHVTLMSAGGLMVALPVDAMQETRLVQAGDHISLTGMDHVTVHDVATPARPLAALLERPVVPPGRFVPAVVLAGSPPPLVLLVDELIGIQEVVVKPLGSVLERVPNVSGAALLAGSLVCMVLNPQDLLLSAQGAWKPTEENETVEVERPSRVLVVEDSVTVRTQVRRILEAAGYQVTTAEDGLDAWGHLGRSEFDAVVSDIEMPYLDGLELAERIRREPRLASLPIILVTSRASDEDRRRGFEVGANAYLTKGAFNQDLLLQTLKRLV